MEEVGIGPLTTSAHPPSKLVKLSEPEQVGTSHHQGVDRRHVDPRLDDGGADEHVSLPIGEVEDDLLKGPFVHLPMRDGDSRLGDEGSDPPGRIVDVRHPVVHEEHLALTQELASDGLGDSPLVGLPDIGQDRSTVGGGRRDHRQIPDPRQCHLQGARDRAGGQGEHVDPCRHPLDRLFVRDPEALLFVDDQEAEILEVDVLGQESVRPDDHVDSA